MVKDSSISRFPERVSVNRVAFPSSMLSTEQERDNSFPIVEEPPVEVLLAWSATYSPVLELVTKLTRAETSPSKPMEFDRVKLAERRVEPFLTSDSLKYTVPRFTLLPEVETREMVSRQPELVLAVPTLLTFHFTSITSPGLTAFCVMLTSVTSRSGELLRCNLKIPLLLPEAMLSPLRFVNTTLLSVMG